jgi:hypothetical protein
MALLMKNLSLLGHANGFSQWHYRSTTDTAAAIVASNYFNMASDMLRVGDRVMIDAMFGTDSATYGTAVVTSNSGGVVNLTDVTALVVTDAG